MENDKIKTSRASQTRDKIEVKKVWTPPNSLDAPPAPTGYRHQWIRSEILGTSDAKNVASSLREGWELVRADEYPDTQYPEMTEGRYAGIIGVGGLLLARIPEEIALQIDAYYKKQNDAKEEAVENNLMKEQHPSMKFHKESNTRVTFGGTKKQSYNNFYVQQNKLNRTGGPSGQVHKKETNTMANASTVGFGLRTTMTLGNTPATSGQSEYKIKSGLGVGIFKNNPISIQDSSGDEGYIQDASFATTDDGGSGGAAFDNSGHAPLIGVFNGAFYIDNSTSKPTFANSVAAGTTFGTNYNTGSTDGFGFVNDNPFQEYVGKSDAVVTQSMYGSAGYNTNSFTASDAKDGQSTVTLDIGGGSAGTHMFKLVRSADDPNNNDNSAIGSNQIVVIAPASSLYN